MKPCKQRTFHTVLVPLLPCAALLFGTQALSGFEQSSYALFQLSESAELAVADDGRLTVDPKVLTSGADASRDQAQAAATKTNPEFDFTSKDLNTGTGGFGSSFNDFGSETPEPEKTESLNFDLF